MPLSPQNSPFLQSFVSIMEIYKTQTPPLFPVPYPTAKKFLKFPSSPFPTPSPKNSQFLPFFPTPTLPQKIPKFSLFPLPYSTTKKFPKPSPLSPDSHVQYEQVPKPSDDDSKGLDRNASRQPVTCSISTPNARAHKKCTRNNSSLPYPTP